VEGSAPGAADRVTDRELLGARLRTLRKAAGFSAKRLGEQVGRSQSWASKTERGETTPQPEEVDTWALICSAPTGERDELVALAEKLNTQLDSWRASVAPGRVRLQEEIGELEAAASVIRVWQPNIIPGLLQSPGYVEWVFRLGRKGAGPVEALADIVQARAARQTVLDDLGKRFEFVVGQAAIERLGHDLYVEQADRLHLAAARPNVYLGVVRFDAAETVHQHHGYAILGDPQLDDDVVVSAETVTRPLTLRKAWEVGDYLAHFAAVKAASRAWLPDS
jgi:transcriptional regulator with XRE-family HTH domain